MIDYLDLSGYGRTRIAFWSYAYMTIIYLVPLLDCIGNSPVWSECIFPVGLSGWLMDAYMLMNLFSVVLNVGC